MNVAKPKSLPSSEKIQDVLNSDSMKRFDISLHPHSGQIMVSLSLQGDEETERLCEEWRDNIASFLSTSGGSPLTTSILGGAVPRPQNLSRTVKFRDVVLADPSRFQVQGFGDAVSVRLRNRKNNKKKPEEWTTVTSSRREFVQLASHSSSSSSSGDTWSRIPVAAAVMSVDSTTFNPQSSQSTSSSASNGTPPPPGLRQPFSNLSLGSNASIIKSSEVGATRVTPNGGSNCSSSAATPPPAAPPSVTAVAATTLSDWFPVIFDGFSSTVIESFVALLNAEGFLTVDDLQLARDLAQLSLDYLQSVAGGFRMGHFNRLMKGLQERADQMESK